MIYRNIPLLLVSFIMLCRLSCAGDGIDVPTPLKSWEGWALYGLEDAGCPSPYNDPEARLCMWPSSLELTVEADAGVWSLDVQVFRQTWLPLPGDNRSWPVSVTIDDTPVPVVLHDGIPSIQIDQGKHAVRGQFQWRSLPEKLSVPTAIGIITLQKNGDVLPIVDRDATGAIWFRRSRQVPEQENQLNVQVYRMLEDARPLWLRTELELTVSGKSREELIGAILPKGWDLSFVDAPIPVAIDADGIMRVQVRPGTWKIHVDAFRTQDMKQFAYAPSVTPAVPTELIGLQGNSELRVTEFEGVSPVDVHLTTFPKRWRQLPVFRWDTTTSLSYAIKARGLGQKKPDRFEMTRQLWLDDDGHGITYEDTIVGACGRISRLDAADDHLLEVVRIDDERQLITRDPRTGKSGIELRSSRPRIRAIGRTSRSSALSAIGWQSPAEQLTVSFALPPGWRMLAVFGADRVEGDWLTAWTLLDLFLLLVFTVGVYRLRGLGVALVAFFAFGLAYHEFGSPRFTWLFLLIPVALLAVTQSSSGLRWLRIWRFLAVGLLLVYLVPFVMSELQLSLFPQLESQTTHYRPRYLLSILPQYESSTLAVPDVDSADLAMPRSSLKKASSAGKEAVNQVAQQQVVAGVQVETSNMMFAPGTYTQTGIARPSWRGNQVSCWWDGPVSVDQSIRTILLPASWHRVLALIRVILELLMLRLLLSGHLWKQHHPRSSQVSSAVAGILLVVGGMTCSPAAVAQDFPSDAMLETLRQRLLRPDEAFPHAAEIPSATLKVRDNQIQVDAEIHAAVECAVPVPGKLPTWSPVTVTVNDEPAVVCRRDDGFLWIWLDQGVHAVSITGVMPDANEWVVDFLLPPRRLEVSAPKWTIKGLDREGHLDGPLFLNRQVLSDAGNTTYEQKNYQSVVQVDRVLEIGLVWRLHTTVRRLSEPGKAITVQIPLLENERLLSDNDTSSQGAIEVVLPADAMEFKWESKLPITQSIDLTSKAGPQWVERWSLVPSAVWNVQTDGIEAVYETENNTLIPVWYPWPEESVRLMIDRPEAVDGKILTVQSAKQKNTLGTRRRNTKLDIDVESSLGGDFSIQVPEKAVMNSTKIDGRTLPIRQEHGRVLVPLKPGRQELSLEWSTVQSLQYVTRVEPITLPAEVANVTTEIQIPESQWILWTHGPLRGPAVQFWAILIAAILLGSIIGQLPNAPLKTYEWVLLLIGLTQVSVFSAGVVVAWLFIMEYRRKQKPESWNWFTFDLMQLFLIGLTLTALVILISVVNRGLLGYPEMFITGNGSYRNRLIWFSPQSGPGLTQAWAITVSIWYYRLLMLLWGLWLANAVTRWLITGLHSFKAGGSWRWRKVRSA